MDATGACGDYLRGNGWPGPDRSVSKGPWTHGTLPSDTSFANGGRRRMSQLDLALEAEIRSAI